MEKAGQLLARTSRVFFNLNGANTNPELQKLQREMAPKLAAHSDAITLDPARCSRASRRSTTSATRSGSTRSRSACSSATTRDFVRAGAKLPEADKEKLKAINTELADAAGRSSTRTC